MMILLLAIISSLVLLIGISHVNKYNRRNTLQYSYILVKDTNKTGR